MPNPSAFRGRRWPSSDFRSGRGRQRAIDSVLAGVDQLLQAGASPAPAEIETRHAELMPELGRQLQSLLAREARPGVSAAPPDSDPPPQTQDEDVALLRDALAGYEVLERIRQGGQGVVYRARQRGTERIVAIKVLLDGPLAGPAQRARFAREIELVARLRHANIISVYESGVVRSRPYYVMEYVAGDPIDDYAALADLTARDVVGLMVRVCRAVHHAHQNGVIHRDLNPANILVDAAGEPRVYDFGLAKDLWADPADGYTHTGLGCGTLPYISPEQAGGGNGCTDVRTDVYALGLILYELLTDMFPYPVRGEPAQIRQAIISQEALPVRSALAHGEPDWAPGRAAVDRDLELVLAKALAKDKDERYQSVAALADDLERWLAGEAVAVRAGSRVYVVRKFIRRHRAAAALAGVLAVAGVAWVAGIAHYWARARADRDRARAAACTAYELFDLALTDIEDSVRPLAGGVAVRDRLLGRLTERLPELELLAGSDAALAPVTMRLAEKRGDIATQAGQAAAGHYQRFLDETRQAAATATAGPQVRADVVRAYRKLGSASPEPAAIWEEGFSYGRAALDRDGRESPVAYELAKLSFDAAERSRVNGDTGRALELYAQSAELSPPPEAAAGADLQWLELMGETLSGRAMVLQKLGAGAEARAAAELALRLREAAVARAPANTVLRLALLRSLSNCGALLRDAGELPAARVLLERAAAQSEQLGNADPEAVAWNGDRYAAHHRLASLLMDMNELEPGRAQCAHAHAIAENWSARDGGEDALDALCMSVLLQAKLARRMDDWDAALAAYERALAIGQRLHSEYPSSERHLGAVVGASDGASFCERKRGRLDSALAHAQHATQMQQVLTARCPDSLEYVLHLQQCRLNLAGIHIDRATPEGLHVAAELLALVGAELDALGGSGRLAGWERKHEHLDSLLRQEQKRITQEAGGAPRTAIQAVEEPSPAD